MRTKWDRRYKNVENGKERNDNRGVGEEEKREDEKCEEGGRQEGMPMTSSSLGSYPFKMAADMT